MGIVLSVLQILGITLLVVMAILVFLILVILFVPICYTIQGEIQETKWISIRFSWLLYLIRAKIFYEDDLIYGEIGIFWKKMTFSHELTQAEDKKDITEERTVKKGKKKVNIISRLQTSIEKIKVIYPRIKKIITDERNKQAMVHLKKEVFYFFKILLPKKSRVNACFSTGSPDTTGQLCGVIACFPVMYQKGWVLRPDFTAEKALFLGDFWGKGRIYNFRLAGIFLRILFDKNCRRLYTMIDRLLKRIENKPGQEDK